MNAFILTLAVLGGLLLVLALIILGVVVTPSIVTAFKIVPFKIQKMVEIEKEYISKKSELKSSKKQSKLLTEDVDNEIIE
jgi:hypothetical protein